MTNKRCSFCGEIVPQVVENPSGDKAICMQCLSKFSTELEVELRKPKDHERVD